MIFYGLNCVLLGFPPLIFYEGQGLGEVTYGIESSVSLVPESATSAAVITNTGR